MNVRVRLAAGGRTISTVDPFLLVGALAVGAGLLPVFAGYRYGRSLEQDWQTAVAACGIGDVTTTNDGGARTLRATHGALTIVLTPHGWRMRPGTRVAVSGLAADVELRRRAFAATERSPDPDDTVIGDAAFDAVVVVRAEPLVAHSLLDFETRRRLLALVLGHEELGTTGARFVSLAEGRFVATCPFADIRTRAERLGVLLRALLVLCDRLARPGEIEERVAENLHEDPLAAVRLRALRALIDRPGHPVARDAVRAALADADDEVRWTAALAAGDEGFPLLRALASDPSTEDARAGQAIARMGAALGGAEASRILDAALRDDREQTTVACLQSPVVASMPETETRLIAALVHANAVVREAAAAALGRVGTAHAVAPLREAETTDRARARTVGEAIASIHARLVGADHGQLALAQPAGELSLAEDARGRVSRAEEQ
ncbi:MAG: HEAT repeat domain-containing protein [Vicinamibacteria bacterium]